MNTRTDADGNKVLFLEEAQSDFGQSYKKEAGKAWEEADKKYADFMKRMENAIYRDWETDRKSTRLNSSHRSLSRMPSSA